MKNLQRLIITIILLLIAAGIAGGIYMLVKNNPFNWDSLITDSSQNSSVAPDDKKTPVPSAAADTAEADSFSLVIGDEEADYSKRYELLYSETLSFLTNSNDYRIKIVFDSDLGSFEYKVDGNLSFLDKSIDLTEFFDIDRTDKAFTVAYKDLLELLDELNPDKLVEVQNFQKDIPVYFVCILTNSKGEELRRFVFFETIYSLENLAFEADEIIF